MSFNFADDPLQAFEAEFLKASKLYADLLSMMSAALPASLQTPPLKSPLLATFLLNANKIDPTAMSLATVSNSGLPSVRTVLFKGLVRNGFSFYTNYESQKGRELVEHPQTGLLFHWSFLEQQVRIEGTAEKLTRSESEAYFRSRDRLSQIGAWASEQSREIPDPNWLIKRFEEFEKKFPDQVPCPPHWGGFRVEPRAMEFWFGRPGRLHERYVYERQASGWRKSRKSP